MARIRTDIPLNDKQVDMFNLLNSNDYSEYLFYGSSRSGKTFLILYWLVIQSLAYRANCLVVRNTFTSLLMGMIKQTLPSVLNAIAKLNGKSRYEKLLLRGQPLAKYNGKDNILLFYNGAYIQFASMHSNSGSDNSSYDKVLSTEWAHIFCDEVSEIDYAAVDTLRSRLAQKITDKSTGEEIEGKMLFALNPTSKAHWTYKRFFEYKTVDSEPLSEDIRKRLFRMHFNTNDNQKFIAGSYLRQLQGMSRLQRQRFYDGEYADVGAGKVFTNLTFLRRPAVKDIEEAIIYTDPSAKDQKTSDFKASVLLVRTKDCRIWLYDCRAVQGTSRQMLDNIYELYKISPIVPRVVMERRQLPLDFDTTYRIFQSEKKWTCPMEWDTMNHGDKFSMIEATLEPLVNGGRFIFCKELKDCGCYEQIIDQFVRFAAVKTSSRHDDIPDAAAKGTSYLNYNSTMEGAGDAEQGVMFYMRGKGLSTNDLCS